MGLLRCQSRRALNRLEGREDSVSQILFGRNAGLDEFDRFNLRAIRQSNSRSPGLGRTTSRSVREFTTTCAVREATNGPEFCRRAKQEVGLDIDVISAEREARLAFYSVERAFDLAGKNVVVADIGGGSTELILASGNVIEAMFTTRPPPSAIRCAHSR